MAKKELTITEFRAIIKEEALKLKKRIVLENEKKTLQAELNSLLNESCTEEIDEANFGMVGRLVGHEDSYRQDIIQTAQKLGVTPTEQEIEALLQQTKADKGQGQVMKSRDGKLFYKPSVYVAPHGTGGHNATAAATGPGLRPTAR